MFRQALRSLLASPVFSVVSIVSLGVGVGVCTVVFASLRAIYFTPLPYFESERIVEVGATKSPASLQRVDAIALDRMRLWNARAFRTLETFAARGYESLVLEGEVPERVQAEAVSGSFFEVLGMDPTIGRTLDPDDDRPSAERTAVLSYSLWQERFGGDRSVLGTAVRLSAQAYVIVGVMPLAFEPEPRIWVPAADFLARGSITAWHPIARLREGASLEEASLELQTTAAAELASDRSLSGGMGAVPVPIRETSRSVHRPTLWIVIAIAAGVLFLAITNLTTLSLARAAQRSPAAALRLALGASSWQLSQSLLLESLLLASAGTALGWALSFVAIRLMGGPVSNPFAQAAGPTVIDMPALAFAAAVSLGCAGLVGLEPVRHMVTVDMRELLRGGNSVTSLGPRQRLTRNGVVALQVGFAVVFASVSGVLSLAYLRFGGLDMGYDGERVVTVMPDYAMRGLGRLEQEGLASTVVARARLYPGVESATVWRGGSQSFPPRPELNAVFEGGMNESLGRSGLYRYYDVDPSFFQTLGISVVQGRVFSPVDVPSSTAVGVVSQSGAAAWWPGQDPIGRRLKLGESGQWITVVGVAEDAAQLSGLGRDFSVTTQGSLRHLPLLYRPISQSSTPTEGWLTEGNMVGLDGVVLAARVASNVGPTMDRFRSDLSALEPGLPLRFIGTLQDYQVGAYTGRLLRLYRALLTALAVIGLFLALLGVAGVVTDNIVRRTREIGIRKALGARSQDVTATLARESLITAATGVTTGLLAVGLLQLAMPKSATFQGLLLGGKLSDWRVLGAVALSTLLMTLVTAYLCARSADRMEPATALRAE